MENCEYQYTSGVHGTLKEGTFKGWNTSDSNL